MTPTQNSWPTSSIGNNEGVFLGMLTFALTTGSTAETDWQRLATASGDVLMPEGGIDTSLTPGFLLISRGN